MALGVVQSVLVCQPVASVTPQDQQYCPSTGGQLYAPRAVSAYVIDPAQISSLEAATAPFDYGYASGLWAFGFSTVVALFVISHGIGHVVGMIRKA